MATSPSIEELASVTDQRRAELNESFAEVITRIITKDCPEQILALAAADPEVAYSSVIQTLDGIAIQELHLGAMGVDNALHAYENYLNERDFKSLDEVIDKAINKAQSR